MERTISMVPRARVLAGVGGIVAALLWIAFAGIAPAHGAQTITMAGKGKNLRFGGAKAVRPGAQLRVVNKTKPAQVGPHTLSLAQKKLLPKNRRQEQRCFDEGRICFDVAVAHEFDFVTGEVGAPLVDAGLEGWDTPFTADAEGDSWYTETRDESFSQAVSAESGRTLHYFCAVHPSMQGKIEVR